MGEWADKGWMDGQMKGGEEWVGNGQVAGG